MTSFSITREVSRLQQNPEEWRRDLRVSTDSSNRRHGEHASQLYCIGKGGRQARVKRPLLLAIYLVGGFSDRSFFDLSHL